MALRILFFFHRFLFFVLTKCRKSWKKDIWFVLNAPKTKRKNNFAFWVFKFKKNIWMNEQCIRATFPLRKWAVFCQFFVLSKSRKSRKKDIRFVLNAPKTKRKNDFLAFWVFKFKKDIWINEQCTDREQFVHSSFLSKTKLTKN